MGNGTWRKESALITSVHPHAYGERAARGRCDRSCRGSSPRIWGTDPTVLTDASADRFIPTHMGNGRRFQRGLLNRPVHPHAYGERSQSVRFSQPHGGSSPRIWGTVDAHRIRASGNRFIPTHMGNGGWQSEQIGVIAVHPHAYGERQFGGYDGQMTHGSSPRIWGTAKRMEGAGV